MTISLNKSAASTGLKIGQVAEYSGLPVKTIRFYCDQGLIQPTMRTNGGYRLFDGNIYAELSLIRTLRGMDVPLSELKKILELRRSGVCNCNSLKSSIESRLAAIDQRIKELVAMRHEFGELLEQWQDCGGAKPTEQVGGWLPAASSLGRAGQVRML